MKKAALLLFGMYCSTSVFPQPTLKNYLLSGISVPSGNGGSSEIHNGQGIHFGNHLDMVFGNAAFRFGLGAYLGQITSLGTDDEYKRKGQAIAEKFRLPQSQLTYNESAFSSTQMLLGPVLSWTNKDLSVNFWAKGGYGINQPGRYAVVYREGVISNNVYVSQAGDNKNALAWNTGAGIRYDISRQLGLMLSGNYFSTKSDQSTYNYEREKGTAPTFVTSANQFIQASIGLQFDLGGGEKEQVKRKRTSKTYSDKADADKTSRNDREKKSDGDSLIFVPEKIELRGSNGSAGTPLKAINNYVTAFAYRGADGAEIGQCSAFPGDPIPGLDIKLKSVSNGQAYPARTNADGSFGVNNIPAGDYVAQLAEEAVPVTVRGNLGENGYKVFESDEGGCGLVSNNIVNVNGKTYVEVVTAREAGSGLATGRRAGKAKYENLVIDAGSNINSPRDAGSGLATGRRTHKPYRVVSTDFDTDFSKIYAHEGRLYAEVIAAHTVKSPRDAASGLATGKRMVVTGDVDGDGFEDSQSEFQSGPSSARDAGSGLPTGKRQYQPLLIVRSAVSDDCDDEDAAFIFKDANGNTTGKVSKEILKSFFETGGKSRQSELTVITAREAGSGMATGRRSSKILIRDGFNSGELELRDAGSGMATGKRQHKPVFFIVNQTEEGGFVYEVVSPRDASSGLPTGRRMHIVSGNLSVEDDNSASNRDAGGPSTSLGMTHNGRRQYQPLIIRVGGEDYRVIHRDLAARNEMRAQNNNTVRSNRHDNAIIVFPGDEDGDGETDEVSVMTISDKGIQESGKGINQAGRKGIQESGKGITQSGKGINQAGKGIQENGIRRSGENPLFEQSGNSGTNPMFEGMVVNGSNGNTHTLFLAKALSLETTSPSAGNEYKTIPVKWASPDLIDKGNKTVNTSRGNIKHASRMSCLDGTCVVDAIVEVDGVEYEAVITGKLKAGHDVALNAIRNMK
ncbi:MAG: carboxypeptidase regulatory-like domain-containing protein [Gemmatimonadaceae bacterium]|nr:carboxypeptidase regulatory-like domain-containing protein [Chitinophagaceae bacterium]